MKESLFKKNYVAGSVLWLCLISITHADNAKQPLIINKKLMQRLEHLENARQVEALLGPACCCVPIGDVSHEVAICQWKVNATSNSTLNTLNVTFEVDRVAAIHAITKDGNVFSKKV